MVLGGKPGRLLTDATVPRPELSTGWRTPTQPRFCVNQWSP